MKMTQGACQGLAASRPSKKQTLYWGEGTATPGLGILVSGVSATKWWVCQGNLPSGKARRITIGPVAVFSIEPAWEQAKPKLAALLKGKDPKVTSSAADGRHDHGQVLEDYLKDNSNFRPITIASIACTPSIFVRSSIGHARHIRRDGRAAIPADRAGRGRSPGSWSEKPRRRRHGQGDQQ